MLGTVLAALSAGCREEPKTPVAQYVPTSESARAGLVQVMDDWLEGISPEDSGARHPKVHIVDQTRRPDQRLVRYEIMGEMPADNARAFAVRVHYDGADESEVVRFLAVGVEPLWIFREEDYETIWMHEDEETAETAAGEAVVTDQRAEAGEPAETP